MLTIQYYQNELNDYTDEHTAQAKNRVNLASGVKGLNCVYVGRLENCHAFTSGEQYQAIETIHNRLYPDEIISSLEVYDNGSMNVYGRVKGKDTWFGFWAVRKDEQS